MFEVTIPGNNEVAAKEVMDGAMALLMKSLTASGINIADLGDAEDEEVLIFRDTLALYKKAENYAIAQARHCDKVEGRLKYIENKLDRLLAAR